MADTAALTQAGAQAAAGYAGFPTSYPTVGSGYPGMGLPTSYPGVASAYPPGTAGTAAISPSGVPISTEAAEAAKEAPAKAHWTGSTGLVIAIIALVLVILVIILRFVWPSEKTVTTGNTWAVNTSTASTNTIVGGNGVVYANRASGSTSNVALTITTPSGPSGQTFIIDNQGSSTSTVTLTLPAGVTVIGGGGSVISAGQSAQFLWVSSSEIHRYWTSS